jgi:pentatricopeptide repeat protein
MESNAFYTATMAKVYAKQGHYEKAIEIYRFLLGKEPDQQELAEALAELEAKVVHDKQIGAPQLANLLSDWVATILKYRQIKTLNQITGHITKSQEVTS